MPEQRSQHPSGVAEDGQAESDMETGEQGDKEAQREPDAALNQGKNEARCAGQPAQEDQPPKGRIRDLLREYGPELDTAANIVVAFFAFAVFFVTCSQWDVSNRQLKLSVRPQMAVTRIAPLTLKPNERVAAEIALSNVGAGPALNTYVGTGAYIAAWGGPGDALDQGGEYAAKFKEQHAVIGNREDASVTARPVIGPFSPETLGRLTNIVRQGGAPELTLWLYGEVRYATALGDLRELHFCQRWEPSTGGWAMGPPRCNWTK